MKDKDLELVSCENCIHRVVCNFIHNIVHCEKKVKEKGCENYQPELSKNSVVLTQEELEEKYEPSEKFMSVVRELEDLKQNLEDRVILSKEEYEKYKIIEYMGKKSTTIPAYKLIKTFREIEEKASKEMAEKFEGELKAFIKVWKMAEDDAMSIPFYKALFEKIGELAKQFVVEIKEN